MRRPLLRKSASDATALALSVDRRRSEPLALQLGRQLREMILTGRMPRAARLPSSRALALDLGLSRATVVHAYEQLASEGYLEGRHGSGMFVSSDLPEQVLQLQPAAAREVPARQRKAPATAARPRPFQIGAIDPALFPFKDWSRLLQRTWRAPSRAMLSHSDPFGWHELRVAIAEHLMVWRGIACEPARIVVTSGTADAVELIARVALGPGARVVVEDPGYAALRYMLQRLDVTTVPVGVDADGLDVGRLGRLEDMRGVIVTPSRQFPLGATLPLARRLALIEWAARNDAAIIEDDFDSEYRYAGMPLPALTSLDTSERAIYAGSFSKVLLPTLRLGFVVLPDRLIGPAQEHLRQRGAMASLVAQPALAEFMRSGAYATHIRRTRRIYARRMAALMHGAAGLARHLTLSPTAAGMHVVADLTPAVARRFSDTRLAGELAEAGILAAPMTEYFAGPPTRQALLLGFSGFSETEIASAVQRMAGVLDALAARADADG